MTNDNTTSKSKLQSSKQDQNPNFKIPNIGIWNREFALYFLGFVLDFEV
jgi:hypothetical protein